MQLSKDIRFPKFYSSYVTHKNDLSQLEVVVLSSIKTKILYSFLIDRNITANKLTLGISSDISDFNSHIGDSKGGRK
jgi:hypothetical protein